MRWEYYSLPRRADHGIEVYDFAANRLLICGVGPNDENCGIEVEKNLFTPRLGIAYRPMEDFVIRAGYSRNPQSNNPGRQQMVPSQSFPQTIVINEAAPNNVTAVGSLSAGCDDRAAGGSEQRRAGAAARAPASIPTGTSSCAARSRRGTSARRRRWARE